MIKAYKLYTGEEGHSHVKEGYVEEIIPKDVLTISFKETPAGSIYDWHTAPTTQYVICLTGTLEFSMNAGETFTLLPGEVLIAMDTTGSGHCWKILGNDPWRRTYVTFNEGAEINFVEQ